MNESRRLRTRILTALVSSGALAALPLGCGGSTNDDTGQVSAGGTTSSGGSGGTGASGGSGGSTSSGGSGGMAGTAGMAGAPNGCAYGKPVTQCYTLAQLEYMANNPPFGGEPSIDGGAGDGGIKVTECLPFQDVQNDCCITATSGPVKQNDLCCYVFCDGACCGRPLIVDGAPRFAQTMQRSDWLAELLPFGGTPELDSAASRALHRAWLRDAQMEHASVASFARFTLELLGLGAPPDLVADAQRAALDEVDHARLCFALAARYGEADVGPGALDVSGSAPTGSLLAAVEAAVLEGCIGETTAALIAREQLARAADAQVRRALGRIAEDESRHAELAWRFVAWALEQGGAPVRDVVERAFARPEQPAEEPTNECPAGVWHTHGRLTPAELLEAARDARRQVIEPCARALLQGAKRFGLEHGASV